MSAEEQARAVRRGAGLFRLGASAAGENARAVLCVAGGDRVRWLNGMISNDVSALAPGPERSGCHAALLTPKGMLIADLHVLLRPDAFWLDVRAGEAEAVRARLDRYIVADDVTLADVSDRWDRLGLEGPAAAAVFEAAAGPGPLPARDACVDREAAGVPVVVAAFGWTGEPALQLFAPRGRGDALAAALVAAGKEHGLVEAGAEALEILRIEAGVPRGGAELADDVLPDEARLERTISTTKGCYTGQEIVARLRSRGHVNHRLVGLRCEGAAPPAVGAEVVAAASGRRTGEVTSACRSPVAGCVALAFVRREDALPGTAVEVAGALARVDALPLVPAGASEP